MSDADKGTGDVPGRRAVRRAHRWRRRILWTLLVLVAALGAAIAFAPAIVSRYAPGLMQNSVNGQIPGKIAVGRLSLSWGGPSVVGPVELRDEQGKSVGTLSVEAPVGVWRVLSERWWSATKFDVGDVKVSGKLEVVRGADGRTNLERALGLGAPAVAKTAPAPATGGGGVESLRTVLRLENLDLSFTDLGAPAGSPTAAGVAVTGFGGPIDVDYRPGPSGVAVLQANLAGAIRTGAASAAGAKAERQTIVVDATAKMDAAGKFADGSIKFQFTNVPTGLVDVLAGLGGELAPALGPRVDVKINGAGNLDKARVEVAMAAEGAGADLTLAYNGERIILEKPGRIWARSTGFLGGLPGARNQIGGLASTVKLDRAPGVEVLLDSVSVPLPKALLSGPSAANQAGLLDRIDLRSASIDAKLKVEAVQGQVAIDGGQWKPFKVEPVVVALAMPELGKGADVTAGTTATVGGEAAGALAVNLHAGGLTNDGGRLTGGLPRQLQGDVKLTGASTALLQPIVAGLGLPVLLQEDVGPRISVDVAAVSTAGESGGAPGGGAGVLDLPPTNINAMVTSDNLNISGPLRIENNSLTTRGDGIKLTMRSATPLARRFLAGGGGEPAPVTLGGLGLLTVTVKDLAQPLDGKGPNPLGVSARVEATLSQVQVSMPGQSGAGPVGIAESRLTLVLPAAQGAGPSVGLEASLTHEGKPFAAKADVELPDVFKSWPPAMDGGTGGLIRTVTRWRPAGHVDITGAPASLASLAGAGAGAAPAADDAAGQVEAMVRKLLGQSVDIKVAIAQAGKAGEEPRTALMAGVKGGGITVDSAAELSGTEVAISRLSAAATVSPGDVDGVLGALASAPHPEPAAGASGPAGAPTRPMRLKGPATVRLSVDPLRAPLVMGAGTPGGLPIDLAKAGDVGATLTVSEPLILDNLPITEKGAAAGVMGLTARLTGRASDLIGSDSSAPVKGSVEGDLIDGSARPLAHLKTDLSAPRSMATAEVSAALTQVQTGALDALLGKGGMLPGALGDGAEVRASGKYAKEGASVLEASVLAPRLKTSGPMKIIYDSQRIALASGAVLTWSPDVAWLNTKAFPSPPGGEARPAGPVARIDPSQPLAITLNIDRLTVSTPTGSGEKQTQGPMKAGVFDLAAAVTTPKLTVYPGLIGENGKEDPPLVMEGIRASVSSAKDKPGTIAADFIAQVAGAGSARAATSTMKATIGNLADARGVVTTQTATLEAAADVKAFPTPVVDLLANQGGLLTEGLGPVISLTASASGVSANGGTIRAKATSARASATIGGQIRNKSFVQTEPVEIRLTQITPNFTRQLAGSLPVIGTLEKGPTDEPAIIKAENLVVPVDSDMKKLSGKVSVDPGVARFTTTGPFQQLLKITGTKQAGAIGQRLEPFVVHMAEGRLTYDRFKIPLGEFTVETKGQVDLVNRTIDVVTYAPFFALTDEAAGGLTKGLTPKIGQILPGVIDRLTLVPIRTHGSLDGPKTEVDVELFFKETGENLLKSPGKLIEGVTGGKLEDLLKPKKKGK